MRLVGAMVQGMRLQRSALFLTVVLVSAVPVSSSGSAPQKQTAETATQFYLRWRSMR
jgi:hypothetical protein